MCDQCLPMCDVYTCAGVPMCDVCSIDGVPMCSCDGVPVLMYVI